LPSIAPHNRSQSHEIDGIHVAAKSAPLFNKNSGLISLALSTEPRALRGLPTAFITSEVYLRDVVGLRRPASPAHGFRHTFKTLCREVGNSAETA
ncbi:MAG: hypothetical protein EOP82_12825, partial [Variovorax sp.]